MYFFIIFITVYMGKSVWKAKQVEKVLFVWLQNLKYFFVIWLFLPTIGHNINNINQITIQRLSSVAPLNCARFVILIWTHVLCCQPLSRRVPTGIPHKAKVIRLIALVVGLVVEGGCSLLPIWLAGWDGVLGIVVLRGSVLNINQVRAKISHHWLR